MPVTSVSPHQQRPLLSPQEPEGLGSYDVRIPSGRASLRIYRPQGSAQAMTPTGLRRWTNPSVLRLAPAGDPIEIMIRRAREVVLEARDAGWTGPPFNPIALATVLQIPVDASSDVPDARTIVDDRGPRIQYNPQQSRARSRFSIAHEIAHTFFPDVGEAVRHRGGTSSSSDEWQLELLCNVAAAEMVMPIGSLPMLDRVAPLEDLMRERLKYDVSVEAFLMRVVNVAECPLTMFIASPQKNSDGHDYHIDYAVPSSSAPKLDVRELAVPVESVLRHCTAIGATSRGVEDWFAGVPALIECVGIPGYPGSMLPRVAGIVRHQQRQLDDFLHYIHGSVLNPRPIDPLIICQLTNDRALRWGGGVARQMAPVYPNAEAAYGEWIKGVPKAKRLGGVHFARTVGGMTIASLVAQEGYGAGGSRIRYHALDRCLQRVAQHAFEIDASVHMPKIGTGAAGGSWELVEPLVRQNFAGLPKGVWVYELPPRQTQTELEF